MIVLTERFWKERQAQGVQEEGNNLGDDHVYVPARFELAAADIIVQGTYHVVISRATMISSFKTRAVNEMATMFKNSFSNKTNDMIMMAAPGQTV